MDMVHDHAHGHGYATRVKRSYYMIPFRGSSKKLQKCCIYQTTEKNLLQHNLAPHSSFAGATSLGEALGGLSR